MVFLHCGCFLLIRFSRLKPTSLYLIARLLSWVKLAGHLMVWQHGLVAGANVRLEPFEPTCWDIPGTTVRDIRWFMIFNCHWELARMSTSMFCCCFLWIPLSLSSPWRSGSRLVWPWVLRWCARIFCGYRWYRWIDSRRYHIKSIAFVIKSRVTRFDAQIILVRNVIYMGDERSESTKIPVVVKAN